MLNLIKTIRFRSLVRSLSYWATTAMLHLLGVTAVYVVSWWLMLPLETRAALHEAAAHGLFSSHPYELLLHAGLSACFWAMLVITFKLLTTPRETRPLRLVKARGTVIIETLIVFPVFLLFTLGLLQLTILNTAGLLTTLAAFKAGRSIAVWAPEAQANRNGVTNATVQEKARLAAAAAVTPVAPSDFVYNCDGSDSLDTMLAGMQGGGHFTTMSGAVRGTGMRNNLSVSRAFDHSNFFIRGQRKLNFAWCATEVESTPAQPAPGEAFSVIVTYKQMMAMPIVEVVFGDLETVGGRVGFYSTIQREYRSTAQLAPGDAPNL